MSFIVTEEIDDYAAAHTTPPPEYLSELAEETRATLRSPQMLTGTIEGRFLELLVYGLQARRVLELGTYSGYSSLSMAAGLPEGGHIDTCEFDFVFVDADKVNYLNYYEALVPRLAESGLMALDNTLWSGRVLDESDDSDDTKAIRELNDRLAADDRVVVAQLTVRDGVTLVRRAPS